MLYKAMTTTTCDETDVIPAVIGLEFDADGNPLDVITVEEWFDELGMMLINHYGEDFRILLNESRNERGLKAL
ncbi:hypothetical protein AGMMS50239_04410 [Bacteroidia bacterium]|nr:hypothetical protein AGMMS50239_04410 [Bacteroidia bacterium]